MKKLLIPVIPLLLFTGYFVLVNNNDTASNTEVGFQEDDVAMPASDNATIEDVNIEPLQYSIDEVDSLWLVVNKDRPISLNYVPEGLRSVNVRVNTAKSDSELSMRDDAASALEELFTAAKTDGHLLLLGSGYRDSDLQNFYYTNYVSSYGQEEADKFSARPGTSEHQIGLVADVSPASQNCYLETCFAQTPEGQWVRENAHKFGFIIRYPEGKESITGYQFEPWHIRYLGNELATELYETNQTMEEYFELI